MAGQDNHLDRMRVASPCPASWDKMRGTAAVRFCDQCQLHVYDISQLTRGEAEALLTRTEGRLCARLWRRADGTVLTKDCPVGLRAFRRRISRVAGAAITALLSLSASALGQTVTRTSSLDASGQRATLTRTFYGTLPQEGRATFRGIITDPMGAPVADAPATLINEKTKYERTVKSDEDGEFKFGLLEPGTYTLKIESPGFMETNIEHLSLHSNEELRFDVTLELGAVTGVIVCEEPSKGTSKEIVVDDVRVRINE